MAPEQAAGDPDVDHRADLYAWGVVAYELLAGHHPCAGKSSQRFQDAVGFAHGARTGRTGLGDYDAAFDHYERGYEARDFLMTVMNTDPQFRLVPPWKTSAIQDDPRWINIVRRVGLSL